MSERIDCRTVDSVEKGKRYFHPDAESTGSCYDGCCDYYKCRSCGTEFKVGSPDY